MDRARQLIEPLSLEERRRRLSRWLRPLRRGLSVMFAAKPSEALINPIQRRGGKAAEVLGFAAT
jgi:hypothetical protein